MDLLIDDSLMILICRTQSKCIKQNDITPTLTLPPQGGGAGREEEEEMEKTIRLDRKTFLSVAKVFGLQEEDSHLEELYTYVEKLFPNFKVAEGTDLKEIEPMLTLILPKE